MKNKLSEISIILAAFLWGLTGIFVRTLNGMELNNMQLLFFRSGITALSLGIIILLTNKKEFKIEPKDWWYFFGTGVLSFTLFGFCYFYTIQHSSMSLAAMLLYTAPIFVMIMAAIFFREKITAIKIIALIATIFGCIMICTTKQKVPVSPPIILTGLGSGFCYALYSIFGRVALKKYSSITVTFYTFFFAAVASMFVVDFKTISYIFATNPGAIVLATVFAFISAFFPYLLYTLGLKNTEPGKAAVMATFEAVVASLAGIIVFEESITLIAALGIILVLSSVVLLNLKH